MSNYQCKGCGAVYIDNGIGKGYRTIQCKTTSELIQSLESKINILEKENTVFRTALEKISKNSDCVCSLDETCLPMRDAARALKAAKGAK